MRFSKIGCKSMSYENTSNSNLMKTTLTIVHPGINVKGTNISDSAIKFAEDSIKNKPILGYVLRDENGNIEDFDTHNVETKIVKNGSKFDIETFYMETPIGIIPESCNPRYVDIDGEIYFQVDGYIWTNYSNGAYKLVEDNEFKGVSMEIKILDGDWDDYGTYNINKYVYEGVTILGDHTRSGIAGAKITKYSECADYKKALQDIYKEIYSLESEVESMESQVAEVVEEIVEAVDEVVETETQEDAIEVNPEAEIETVETEVESVTTAVEDEESKSKVAMDKDGVTTIVENGESKSEVAMDKDGISIHIEDKTEKVEEENPLEVFSILFDEIPGSLQEIAVKLHEKFNTMNKELDTLAKFKADKDRESRIAEVDKIVSEYSELTLDDIEGVRNDAIDEKLELGMFREKLASLAYAKIKENKQAYSVDNKKVIVPIIEKTEENGYEPYGGIFK
ncbi:MAG: hypothetical protein ACRCX2_36050 [Paraclostridium sp.]